ncbi:MAG: hypothetical protein JO235_23365 [Chroococcidiopsidaceae cyanobacterium CP_BM_RX_35]|nr:hypothetical protein [Chroococcidiopsidaceae cyanobacterium CP_BM_RX_35]
MSHAQSGRGWHLRERDLNLLMPLVNGQLGGKQAGGLISPVLNSGYHFRIESQL